MSRGCFRMMYLIHYSGDEILTTSPCCSAFYTRNVWIPVRHILAIEKYEEMAQFKCKCELAIITENLLKSLVGEHSFPYYIVRTKNMLHEKTIYDSKRSEFIESFTCEYILHPSEYEHVERYLAGTDDPMYDFVHELRHNPKGLPTSPELADIVDKRWSKRERQE
jgi:hypothetical protein